MRPILLVAASVLAAASSAGATAADGAAATAPQLSAPPPVRIVDLTAPDGTALKASYFGAARPGPGALLLHQVNRERKSWDGLATQLAAAGIHIRRGAQKVLDKLDGA